MRFVRIAYLAIAALALSWSQVSHALNPEQGLAEYRHRIWRSGDQGLTGRAYSVAQTKDGYMWLGTTAGLYRFDGVRFEEEEGPSNGLVTVYRSAEGSLYFSGFSHTNMGLVRLNGHKKEVIDPSARVRALMEDEKGTVWYAKSDPQVADDEICSWVPGAKPHCVQSPHQLGVSICSYEGAIWVGTDTGLVRLRDGHVTFLPIPGLTPHDIGVVAILPDGHGKLLVGGPAFGLRSISGDVSTSVAFGGLDGTKLEVNALFNDRNGALWIGTWDDGIYRVYKDQVSHFSAALGLAKSILQIMEDREGSIWFVSNVGLETFSDRRVVTVADHDLFPVNEVDGVSVAKDGTLWVAGEGALMRLRPGDRKFEAPASVAPNAIVTTIFEDHTGTVWVGVNDSLNKLEGNRLVPLKLDGGAAPGMIVSLAEDRDFNLWAVSLGTPRQVLKIDPRTLRITPMPSLPKASRVAADPAGGIYLAAINGNLVHVDSRGAQLVYPHLEGYAERIPQIAVTANGSLLASTQFGLEVLQHGKIQVLSERNGLPCKTLYDSIFDQGGNLWLYMQCGLVQISRDDFSKWKRDPSATVAPTLLDAEDGVDAFDAPFGGSARTPDGVLWFANSRTLQKVKPDAIARLGSPPPVQIERFSAESKQYPIDGLISLAPSTGNIQIDYAGLSFVAPDKMRFRYKLDGFDKSWTEAGPRRQAFYNSLPPATYHFHVIASDNNGVWNNAGASLSFQLAPAFHQTLWFKILCSLVILVLLWLIIQARVRRVEGQVRLRQSIQYSERLRIARQLHDSLLQSMQGLLIRFSSAARAVPPELPVRRAIEDLLDRSDQIIAEARRSIGDLREGEKRSLELAQEITALGQGLSGDGAVPVTVLTNGKPFPLNSDTHENVLLIVREAMLNAFRHAKAHVMEIQIDYRKAEFAVSVRDDGCGIDQSVIKAGRDGHWGLHGMRERAAAIHGKLRILSKVGAGTEIAITVPRIYASVK